MKAIIFILIILSSSVFVLGQTNSSAVTKEQTAKEILEKTLKAQKVQTDKIKGLTVNYEKTVYLSLGERKIEQNISTKLEFSLPDKIHQENSGNYTTNKEISQFTLNGTLFSYKVELFDNDGDKINFDPFASSDSTQLKDNLKKDTFYAFFPIIFDSSIYTPLNFAFIGIAQSKNDKAAILEAVTAGGVNYRYFFDEKTNLLLMMTESWKNKDNQLREKKYFYSDYKEIDGLFIASKIKVEQNEKLIEERTIKNLKINPIFKENYFAVKK
jgi:hypothetical protein